jgi:hypothetical protein
MFAHIMTSYLLLCVGQILSMTWIEKNTSRMVLMLILLLQLRESMLEVCKIFWYMQ